MNSSSDSKRISALTHPMVDILVSCERELLASLNLEPGTYATLERHEQDALVAACRQGELAIVNGGSAANSVVCMSLLGIKTSLMGLAGDDAFGHHFVDELKGTNVTACNPLVSAARTGSCVSLVTPDSERTMRTYLGVAKEFSESDINEAAIAESEWLLVEGYYLTASAKNRAALYRAIEIARANSTRVAFSAAAEFAVRQFKDEIASKILPNVDLVFANQDEARLLADAKAVDDAFSALAASAHGVVVTSGAGGAAVSYEGALFHEPAFKSGLVAVDSTGAGDAFAGAFLAGLTLGLSPQIAAKGAARIAAEVVTRSSSRAPENAQALFSDIIRSS